MSRLRTAVDLVGAALVIVGALSLGVGTDSPAAGGIPNRTGVGALAAGVVLWVVVVADRRRNRRS